MKLKEMALVPIAMGLGATAEQAAGIEAASWAPFVYGAYRYGHGSSESNSSAAMSGYIPGPFTGGGMRKRHRQYSGAGGGRKKFVGRLQYGSSIAPVWLQYIVL